MNKVEDLLIEVAENNDSKLYTEILELMKEAPTPIPQNVKDGISMVLESWQLDPRASEERTNFLISVAQYFKSDFQDLRSSLPSIIKKVLPKGFNKTTSVKAIGVRDSSVSLHSVYNNYLKLITLNEPKFFFSSVSNAWGKATDIDWIAGTIKLEHTNGQEFSEVDLGVALSQSLFFNTTPELLAIVESKKIVPFSNAQETLISTCATEINEEEIRNALFFVYIPSKMTPVEFEKWKEGKGEEAETAPLEEARSVQELNSILTQNKSIKSITDAELQKIKQIFTLIRPTSPMTDYVLWG